MTRKGSGQTGAVRERAGHSERQWLAELAYGSVLGRLPVAPACAVRKREPHRVRPQGDQPRRLTAGRRLSGKTGLQGRDV